MQGGMRGLQDMMKQFGGTGGAGGLGGMDMAELQAMMGGGGGERRMVHSWLLPYFLSLSVQSQDIISPLVVLSAASGTRKGRRGRK